MRDDAPCGKRGSADKKAAVSQGNLRMKRSSLIRRTPMKRGTLFSTKKRTGLRKVSTRRQKELKEYSERRKSFLAMPENRWCPVVAAGLVAYAATLLPLKKRRTTDVHHMSGREGKLLNDERYWLAVSSAGHDWIHNYPNEARRRGWLI